ncbi:MAG: iron ABC transporter permease [Clostridiales bacterium]|nr:iron ABC transporter permease [Clostridiales bacterium]
MKPSTTTSTRRLDPGAWIGLFTLLLLVSMLLGVMVGAVSISPARIVQVLFQGDAADTDYRILYHVRLPRVLACALCGSALAVSGLLVQVLLSNPLASPNLIGANSGAGLAVAVCLLVFPTLPALVPVAAFLGALFACVLIYALSARVGSRKSTIILAGIAVSSILSAGIETIQTLVPSTLVGYNSFMTGGFSGVRMQSLYPAMGWIGLGLAVAWLLRREMDVFSLGDETAASLGMRVKWVRAGLLLTAALLAGAAVSVCGMLGFVGLIVPHLARRLVGYSNRILVPASALLGATLVILCDLLSRVLFSPYEIPVGILLSFTGGPFFLYLIMKRKRQDA